MVRFVGQRRLENGRIETNFIAYAGLPPHTYAGGQLYDTELKHYVPLEIGEWVMKSGPQSYRIVDPEELREDYRKI